MGLTFNKKSFNNDYVAPDANLLGEAINTPKLLTLKSYFEKNGEETIQKLCIPIGRDNYGNLLSKKLIDVSHMLIGGSTGSGKSVFLHSVLTSLILKNSPEDVKFILIDPKRVEFTPYKSIPHLLTPILHERHEVSEVLQYLIEEMEKRYDVFVKTSTMNIDHYNDTLREKSTNCEPLPHLVMVIDEFCDIVAFGHKKEILDKIFILVQKARAAGIHIFLATQKCNNAVIPNIIKNNFRTNISFHQVSEEYSKYIVNSTSAVNLSLRGEALFSILGNKLTRVLTPYVSDASTIDITKNIIKNNGCADFKNNSEDDENFFDPKFKSALQIILEHGEISTSLIQRKLCIGYAKASDYIHAMVELGILSNTKSKKPNVSKEEIENKIKELEAALENSTSQSSSKSEIKLKKASIILLLADGFEEIEALTPLDVLLRLGADIKTVSIGEKIVRGAHGIKIEADLLLSEIDVLNIEHLILPGGMPGAKNLDECPMIDRIIDSVISKGGTIGAICAAPFILGKRGLLSGRHAVCYPGFENLLKGAKISPKEFVVTDGNIITAKGMGSALKFSYALAKNILSKTDSDIEELSNGLMEYKNS